MKGLWARSLNDGLETKSSSLELGWDVLTLELNLGLEFFGDLDDGLELHFLEVLWGTGLSNLDGGLSEHGVGGRILNLVVNLDATIVLLRAGVRLGDSFTNNLKSSRLWHGLGSHIGSLTPCDTDESFVHLGGDNGLEQVLEGVLGRPGINLVNGSRFPVQRLNDGLLSSDGSSEDESVGDISSPVDGFTGRRFILGRV